MKKTLIVLLILLAGAWAARYAYWRSEALAGLEQARQRLQTGSFASARGLLRRYLEVRPDDAEARYLLAESLIKDEALPQSAVQEALDTLRSIPADSQLAPQAWSQVGRIELFVRMKPWAAELALRRVLAVDADYKDAHYLLWKLLDLSARSQDSEPHVWPVLDQSIDPEKPERLREWYLSQFYPTTATLEIDRTFGVFDPAAEAKGERELRRFLLFQKNEPEGPVGYAAEARWMLSQGDPAAAMNALDRGLQANRQAAEASPLFIAARIEALLDLGKLEDASQWFQKWPEPHDGYAYWRWRGMVADEVRDDPQDAVQCLKKALGYWPGHVDWRSRVRIANCLLRMQDREQAAQYREESRRIELLMEDDLHRELYARLNELGNPRALEGVIDFYRQLGRSREADAWTEVVRNLAVPEASGQESGTDR